MENAATMQFMVSTFSDNIENMVASLVNLSAFGEITADAVSKMLPLLEAKGAGDTMNTVLSAISAVTGLTGPILGLGTIITPLLAAFGPALAVLGGAAAIGIGIAHFTKPKADKQIESTNIAATQTLLQQERQPESHSKTQAATPNPPTGASGEIDTAQTLADPFNTGKGDESKYSQYQGQIESSRETAQSLRDAVSSGNAEVAAQLKTVADKLEELAKKPADRNIKSDIVISSLQTTATLEQFIKMLEQVLEEGIPITA